MRALSGVVSSTHWLATQAGLRVLAAGGNAVDAAVAAGFVLQVVEPDMNGPGGEVVALVCHPAEPGVRVVCGQGVAPAAATHGLFADLGLHLVPGCGPLAATVPGAFGAWTLMLSRWGTAELDDVLSDAIGYAQRGYPVTDRIAATIGAVAPVFTANWPTSAGTWLSRGTAPASGTALTNAALADTWTRLLKESHASGPGRHERLATASDAWYRGFVAEEIEHFCARTAVRDVSGGVHRGLLTQDDLGAWQPRVEDPVLFDFGELTVAKTGPWGQCPVFCQQLALLDGLDLGGPDRVHVLVESAKLAFADREAWYGDPRFFDVPLAALLDRGYADGRRAAIGDQASPGLCPGTPGGRRPRLPVIRGSEPGTDWGSAMLPTVGPGDTCHIATADASGIMVSATPSGGWLQGSPVIPRLGFPLGTRAQMFWLQPGLAASLAPGARPRTTLSPTIVLRRGEPWLAFGTPGGDKQDQWSLWAFLAMLGESRGLAAALAAPRGHVTHFPSSFYPRTAAGHVVVEADIGEAVIGRLRGKGHQVREVRPGSLGRVAVAGRDGRRLVAAADRRGGCAAADGR